VDQDGAPPTKSPFELRQASFLNWIPSHLLALSRTSAYVASLLVAAPFFYHLAHRSQAFLVLLEDDYYYYATVADQLVSTGKLTYDGITVTNGFHPLWFLVVVTLRGVFGGFGTAFYVALALVFIVSMLSTFEVGRRFAMTLGASSGGGAAAAAIYSFSTAQLLTDGMECVIAVPLFLWLLAEIARPELLTSRRAAKIGFVSSLAILARLDIALVVPMFIVGYAVLVRPSAATFARRLLAFCAGGVLVAAYATANLMVFGSPLPVSALAKRLVVQYGFNLSYARGVAFHTVYGPTMGVVLPLGLLGAFLLARYVPANRPQARFAGALALIYAFVFFGINALSGWIFFGWYAFPFVPATIAAVVFIYQRWAPKVGIHAQVAAVVLVTALPPALALRYFIQHGPLGSVRDNTLLAMSFDLADRLRNRQGLFAMGAIAGMTRYLIDKPVLQIEGIVADRPMVEHVRRQDPLADVLAEYQADYLIVSLAGVPAERRDGCVLVTQPHAQWAGLRTAKMRGEICSEPIEHFFTERGSRSWSTFPTTETFVWDLRQSLWRNPDGDKVPLYLPVKK